MKVVVLLQLQRQNNIYVDVEVEVSSIDSYVKNIVIFDTKTVASCKKVARTFHISTPTNDHWVSYIVGNSGWREVDRGRANA